MQDEGSRLEMPVRRVRRAVVLGAVLACGCATGVDVTDDELAAICASPNTTCDGFVPSGGGSSGQVGNVGGTGNGTGGTQSAGGTFNSSNGGTGGSFNAGTGGTGGSSNAGTGGSAAGTGGTGGTPQPLAEGECLDTDTVSILYRDRSNGSASDNEPTMVLAVANTGPAFSLGALTIRYWFTADGASGFTGNIDYASLDGQTTLTSDVSVAFGQEFGSDYAELSFSSTASVEANGVREVQLRFHGNPYQAMDQTNDFSFISGATDNTPNPNITPYVSGVQAGGCVPIP